MPFPPFGLYGAPYYMGYIELYISSGQSVSSEFENESLSTIYKCIRFYIQFDRSKHLTEQPINITKNQILSSTSKNFHQNPKIVPHSQK